MARADNNISPALNNLQIELTSRCNLRCRTCVRSHFYGKWQNWDLSEKAIGRILESSAHYSSVHLQGWGESLLRSDCPSLVERFKNTGVMVSLSSNGTIMSSVLARDLIASGLDSMAFSLAGASARQNDALRGMGSFQKCLESIRTFAAERRSSEVPVGINYLLTPENMADLPKMIRLAAELNVDYLVCTNMVHICTDFQRNMALYRSGKKTRLATIFSNAEALFYGIKLDLPADSKYQQPVCSKDPLNNVFIGSDGSVSPCVNLCPPLHGQFPRIHGGEKLPSTRIIFGNLNSQGFKAIWNQQQYSTFRDVFQKRCDIYNRIVRPVSSDFEGMEKLMTAQDSVSRALENSPAPEQCHICPKIYGM